MTRSTVVPVVGIDPGAQGAIALLGETLTIEVMPTFVKKLSGGRERLRTDCAKLISVLRSCYDHGARVAFVENVWGVKGQAAGGAAALGHNVGCIETACAAVGLDVVWVSAVRWKYDVGVMGAGKEGAVALARKMWPHYKHFEPVRGVINSAQAEGCAEAALVAHWGRAKHRTDALKEKRRLEAAL